MELLRDVLRPFAAVSTRDTLLLMPFARLLIKSGIQLCISASGPSSGTEKCRKFRIALATEDTALVTVPMAPRIPEAMLLTRSEPQEVAEEKSQWMLLHQLFASFQICLFQSLRLPEELLCHWLYADQLPPVQRPSSGA